MRWRKPISWGLGLCVIPGLTFGLSVSVPLFVRWVREPTWEESARALDNKYKQLWRQQEELEDLVDQGRVPDPGILRAHQELWKKERDDFEELNRQWKDRYNSRLERFRQDIRRRLGW